MDRKTDRKRAWLVWAKKEGKAGRKEWSFCLSGRQKWDGNMDGLINENPSDLSLAEFVGSGIRSNS
jgi:hypothetical protein